MRSVLVRLILLLWLGGISARAQTAVAPVDPSSGWEGVWSGTITAPNARTEFGLAFIATEKGLLVSVYFPEMFLYGANFGRADLRNGVFQLSSLTLRLEKKGEAVVGTFGPARLPVELHRGGTFSEAPPASTPAPGPGPSWVTDLKASAWASPTASDDTLYIGTVDGKFHAINAVDGQVIWTWAGAEPIYGSAAVDAGAVYFLNDKTELVCLNRSNGELKWRVPLHDETIARRPASNETFNHRAAAPLLDGKGSLYVGSTDGGIYALKARTGRKLWRHETKSPVYASLAFAGDDLVAACFDGTVLRLDRHTRKEVFRIRLGGAVVTSVTVAGDRMAVGCRDCLLYGLEAKKGTVQWRDSYWFSWVESPANLVEGVLYVGGSDFRRVSALDPASGKKLWSTDVGGLSWGSPQVVGDTVYAATAGQTLADTVIEHTGGIVALNRRTGAIRWRRPATVVSRFPLSGYTGSLTVAASQVIAASVDGWLVALPIENQSAP